MTISVLSFVLPDLDTDASLSSVSESRRSLMCVILSKFQIAPRNYHPLGRAKALVVLCPALLTEGLHTGVGLA